MTGVLEVDAAGNISSTSRFELYPPGPIFGAPDDVMLGRHIGLFLPNLGPGGQAVTDLLQYCTRAAAAAAAAAAAVAAPPPGQPGRWA